MRFDLTDLRLFLNVLETGSITGGAERSYMALASASARVRGMEEELGVPLLERGRRGVQPTAAGWTLADHARTVLRQVSDMRGALGDYARGLKAQIRLLCNTAALTEFLPDDLGAFLAQHPSVTIDLHEHASTEIVALITAGKADVGIVADSVDHGLLETRPFRIDQLVVAVPRRHPLAAQREVSFSNLLDNPFVGLMKGSALQDHLDGQAERQGARLDYRIRVHDFDSICRLVEKNAGIGVISETSALRCSKTLAIDFARLTDPWACRRLMVCMRNFNELPLHTRHLIEKIGS
ncbi:LysR substrate-binding domain-containing protein [Geobacter sp. AOG2]|uniref:LysR substrate-binding domain-containing protein n=1 Tax=Geobacter sp. AOG2 TaxID=1566347 RepID=UPI001CC79466|nr:LysR substrate-binding domain-containing protein [Geobacter sp. AOG2]GFE62012.1 LysR family transcriptional regulator [Geobacter sp. AOG2]